MDLAYQTKQLGLAIILTLTALAGADVAADDYSDKWGPAIGQPLPLLEAYDHAGTLRTLDNLTGARGLLLSMNRSADW